MRITLIILSVYDYQDMQIVLSDVQYSPTSCTKGSWRHTHSATIEFEGQPKP